MAVATTMISYGGFLGACGWYGAHTSGAMHSLYAGVGSGAVMVLWRELVRRAEEGRQGSDSEQKMNLLPRRRRRGSSESLLSRGRRSTQDYKKWMIAVHLGLMFNALFGWYFACSTSRSRGDPDKASRAFLFMVMTAGLRTHRCGRHQTQTQEED